MSSYNFTAGLLVRGQIRRYLQEAEYNGAIDSFLELKGWLDSRFLIKNPARDVVAMLESLADEHQAWVDERNKAGRTK